MTSRSVRNRGRGAAIRLVSRMGRARAFRRGGPGVNFAGTLRRLPPPRPISRFAAGAVALACALVGGPERAAAQLDQPLPPPPAREAEKPAPKLTKPPAITKPVEPVYPPEAFAEGLSGEVALLLTLDAEGHVTAVTVSRAAGHGFDEAAVAAAREMEFSPAEVDGKPASIRIEYVIHFEPKVVPAPAPAPSEPEPPAPPRPPPPALGVGRVVVRGLLRERGSREPLPGADVAVIRRGAGPGGRRSSRRDRRQHGRRRPLRGADRRRRTAAHHRLRARPRAVRARLHGGGARRPDPGRVELPGRRPRRPPARDPRARHRRPSRGDRSRP